MTFKSTSVSRVNGKLQVVGDLTLAGVTKSVTLEVDGPTAPQKGMGGKMVIGLSATGMVKRSDFNFAPKMPAAALWATRFRSQSTSKPTSKKDANSHAPRTIAGRVFLRDVNRGSIAVGALNAIFVLADQAQEVLLNGPLISGVPCDDKAHVKFLRHQRRDDDAGRPQIPDSGRNKGHAFPGFDQREDAGPCRGSVDDLGREPGLGAHRHDAVEEYRSHLAITQHQPFVRQRA